MPRRVDESIAVKTAEADELGVRQTGNQPKDAALFGIGHLGLETDQIVEGSFPVFLTQLNHCVRAPAGARIAQSDCAHRSKGQSCSAAISHFFNRHAAFKRYETLKVVRRHTIGAPQRADESIVFLSLERQVEIIIPACVIARGPKCHRHVDRVGGHDR